MTPSERLLLSLRDFIGDALAEPDISPSDIIDSIRDELKELQDYHKVQGGKIEKLLGMLQVPDDVIDFSNYLSNEKIDEINLAIDLDRAVNYYNGTEDTGSVWDSLGKKNKNRFRKLGDK